MRTFSISRTARGKLVTCRSALPPGWPPSPGSGRASIGRRGARAKPVFPGGACGPRASTARSRRRRRTGDEIDDSGAAPCPRLVPPSGPRDQEPVAPPPSSPRPVREIETLWIPPPDGTRLAARAWLPEDAERDPVPAVLEYLPYRKRDGTAWRDALTPPYLAGHGYACVRVDIRGNGESNGLMQDEYLPQEQA